MSKPTTTVIAEQAVLPGRLDYSAVAIDIADGRIVAVRSSLEPAPGAEVIRVPKGKVLLPGLIDTHVHLNQPGRTQWEGFATGTQAAVSGGVTTLVDMPLNSIPPTTTVANLEEKQAAAEDAGIACDTGFWGGIIPGNAPDLAPLVKAGVKGFKCFLLNSGVDEFPHVSEQDIRDACDALKDTNALVMFHAELDPHGHSDTSHLVPTSWGSALSIGLVVALGTIMHARNTGQEMLGKVATGIAGFLSVTLATYLSPWKPRHFEVDGGPGPNQIAMALTAGPALGIALGAYFFGMEQTRNLAPLVIPVVGAVFAGSYLAAGGEYAAWLATRPPKMEEDALQLVLRICRAYPNLRFHIVHLSAASALPALRAARAGTDGGAPVKNLTVETCFHYLCLEAEDVPRDAAQYKCCPPIRDAKNRRELIKALKHGEIQYVVSDHSPCTPELKKGGFMSAWGGVSSLGLGLQLLNTELDVGVPRIVEWLGINQARQVGLEGIKGELKEGCDADFVIFDPEATEVITKDHLLFRNKVSPYLGKTVRGRVEQTYLRGHKVFDFSEGVIHNKSGQFQL
ncbi:hypothetical protein CcaverHIS002_0110900 [Cutaneotrichosporon cavernicola]|uniref:Amidohydrolase-related domain-containing protein n=1 Tax=Cutaneotrichosporon cavernicola TaxID=279322 RepID=A0AA48I2V4_9TREE|nr:uncharacterized protein CcaverHIS019_0110800 [Cutaneotrichosporon cavernicola]BEI80561.1 hypothetical protein CcaverHIS002_0110900 [Cutaneotrichosporon cavernicola]BEI88362.1 hypothetical protein CcaverHIS019_0110800 [Cutaneotrichosporon cavernicola]